jgi:hypothetical protein
MGPTYVSLPDKIAFFFPSPFLSIPFGELGKQTLLSSGFFAVKPMHRTAHSDNGAAKGCRRTSYNAQDFLIFIIPKNKPTDRELPNVPRKSLQRFTNSPHDVIVSALIKTK